MGIRSRPTNEEQAPSNHFSQSSPPLRADCLLHTPNISDFQSSNDSTKHQKKGAIWATIMAFSSRLLSKSKQVCSFPSWIGPVYPTFRSPWLFFFKWTFKDWYACVAFVFFYWFYFYFLIFVYVLLFSMWEWSWLLANTRMIPGNGVMFINFSLPLIQIFFIGSCNFLHFEGVGFFNCLFRICDFRVSLDDVKYAGCCRFFQR